MLAALAACRAPVVDSLVLCDDEGTLRQPVAPAAGDLVIDEIMADPKATADASGEWFEVAVRADVDLNGLEVGNLPGAPRLTISDGKCRHAAAGSYLVFARGADPAWNGGLPAVDVVIPPGLALGNDAGSLVLAYAGEVLDSATWTAARPGVALQREADTTCPATTAYGAGDLGTPGAANPPCPAQAPAGMCLENGALRRVRTPVPGDLRIDELLADPRGTDAGKEWFEVYVENEVDLNGLALGPGPTRLPTTLAAADCLRAAAGSYLVFAERGDPALNGGLPRVDFLFDFPLVNDAGGITLVSDGLTIDSLTYDATREGYSLGYNPEGQSFTAGAPVILCPAHDGDVYGTNGDHGTPGARNSGCP